MFATDTDNPLQPTATGNTLPFAANGLFRLPKQMVDDTPPNEPTLRPMPGMGVGLNAVLSESARRGSSRGVEGKVAETGMPSELATLFDSNSFNGTDGFTSRLGLQRGATQDFQVVIKDLPQMPEDWPQGMPSSFLKWYWLWRQQKSRGEPGLRLGEANGGPQETTPTSPDEREILTPEDGGDGCRTTRTRRRYTDAGFIKIEFDQWLVGGYHRYAKGSDKTKEDIEAEADHKKRRQMADEGLINKEEVGEPDTVTNRFLAKRKELLDECTSLAAKLAAPESKEVRESVAQTFKDSVEAHGLPLWLFDSKIQAAIFGFACPDPLRCELVYEVIGQKFDIGADEVDIKGDCWPEVKIGSEKWTEVRGYNKDGTPIIATIELESWAVVLHVVIDAWWELDADVAIFCRAKAF